MVTSLFSALTSNLDTSLSEVVAVLSPIINPVLGDDALSDQVNVPVEAAAKV